MCQLEQTDRNVLIVAPNYGMIILSTGILQTDNEDETKRSPQTTHGEV